MESRDVLIAPKTGTRPGALRDYRAAMHRRQRGGRTWMRRHTISETDSEMRAASFQICPHAAERQAWVYIGGVKKEMDVNWVGWATLRGKMTTSPSLVRSRRGSPSASRHVKGGNVISFSPGYCTPGPHGVRARNPVKDSAVTAHVLHQGYARLLGR